MALHERPLSPHLQVYRPMYTMVLSISHRFAGLALAVGFLLLAWWLMAVAGGEADYAATAACLGSVPGKFALAAWLLAFWYHLFAGLRHLAWDAGHGFEKRTARRSGTLVVVLALAATAVTVALAWRHFGGGA
jgi:succinate dehydrogenase / fumarate reductase cytochrome b subunit